MRHMNVMWHVGKFNEATWQLLSSIGLTPTRLRNEGIGMVVAEQRLEYKRELVAGDLLTICSSVQEAESEIACPGSRNDQSGDARTGYPHCLNRRMHRYDHAKGETSAGGHPGAHCEHVPGKSRRIARSAVVYRLKVIDARLVQPKSAAADESMQCPPTDRKVRGRRCPDDACPP